ncbi:MAG: hypothetical protein IH598_01665 [Bacteroidales bacterium]|nr:hypothetical protein [Bacteroidales bacterium]
MLRNVISGCQKAIPKDFQQLFYPSPKESKVLKISAPGIYPETSGG